MRQPAMLLIGPTGSGKTPLGDFLEARGLWGLRCLHFDFGAQLRRIAVGRADAPSFSGEDIAFLRRVLETGALLEDQHFSIAERILGGFLADRGADPHTCVVLNGLPRHVGQAERLEPHLDVRAVVVLECPAEVVLERIGTNAGGDREGRTDDDRASVEKKVQTFTARTQPLTDYYHRRGASLLVTRVSSRTTPEEVYCAVKRFPSPFQ